MDTNRNCGRKTSLLAAAAASWLGLSTAQAQTAPTLAQGPASQAVEPGTTVNFTVIAAGAGPFLYQWRFNGTNFPGLITTVAGDGPSSNGISGSYAGDHGPATNASLNAPWGVSLDVSNNLFIADWQNSRIRKVATNGIITTVAGNGTTNFHGDGAQATNAGLNYPRGVCVNSLGNVFICDTGDNRVRKVGTNGIITTVAGGGTNNLGDGGAATNATLNTPTAAAVDALGNLFIADTGNNRIRRVGTNGIITTVAGGGTAMPTNGIMATNAGITQPYGIAVDRFGDLFFSCSVVQGEGVLQAGTNGAITLLGPVQLFGDNYYGFPSGVALDVAGDVFLANFQDNVVLKVGTFQTIAGDASFTGEGWIPTVGGYSGDGAPANQAQLFGPNGVAVDTAGDVFIGDSYNNRIRKVAALGPVFSVADVTTNNAGDYDVVVSSPYGSVTSSVAVLSIGNPPGLTNQTTNLTVFVGSNVTLSATATGTGPFFYQWQFDGTNLPVIITTVAGNGQDGESGDGGQATNAALYAGAVGVDNLGDFFIADSANDRVREVNASGLIATVAGNGTIGFSGDGGAATNAQLYHPAAVAADSAGNLYIADEANDRIRQVAANGVISTLAGNGTDGYAGDGAAATNASLSSPSGVAVDAAGNLYIADQDNQRIRQVGTNGLIHTIAGNGTNGFSGDGGAAINASLSNPADVAVDGLGNIYIADSGNKRIRKVGLNGIIITVAGSGNAGYYGDGGPATNAFFESPASVAVDAFGNFFIADGTEHVREVGLNGIISTVAGNAGRGFSGDGGPPTNAMLSEVYGLATDALGDLFIADTGNNRIRKINAFGPSLMLSNFNFVEAGNYDLIVSSPFGSVTSAVMVVTAMLPLGPLPPLNVILSGSNSLTIQFTGTPGSNYVLQVTTNLVPPVNWQPLATNVAGVNGGGTFTAINILASPALFYRLGLP
jgi:sugar lactone lactonase YvrE